MQNWKVTEVITSLTSCPLKKQAKSENQTVPLPPLIGHCIVFSFVVWQPFLNLVSLWLVNFCCVPGSVLFASFAFFMWVGTH